MSEKELRELEYFLAEHVMGCCDCVNGIKKKFGKDKYAQIRALGILQLPEQEPDIPCDHAPFYTDSPAAAMQVLEKCHQNVVIETMRSADGITIVRGVGIVAEAETLPLAICLFAKKLFSK